MEMDESLVSPLRLTNSKHLLRNATAGSSGTASGSASGTSAGSGSNTTATAPSSLASTLASTLASGSEHVSASQGQGLSNSSNSNSPARLSEVLIVRRIRLDQDLGLPKSPLPLWDLMHPPLDTLPQVGLMPMILNQVRPIPPRATVVITWIMS